jgi:hypothetical protein
MYKPELIANPHLSVIFELETPANVFLSFLCGMGSTANKNEQ